MTKIDKPKNSLARLSLKTIKVDTEGLNKLTKEQLGNQKYLLELAPDPEDYRDIELTEEQAIKVDKKFRRLNAGFRTATPVICPGAELCPRAHKCPFVEAGAKPPIKRECLVEVELFYKSAVEYAQHFGVLDADIIKMDLCQQLAELNVLEWRLSGQLSTSGTSEMVEEQVIGWDEENKAPITASQISNAFKLKEAISAKRFRIMTMLVGTPQEQYKREAATKSSSNPDISKNAALLKAMAKKLMEEKDSKKEPVVIDGNTGDIIPEESAEERATNERLDIFRILEAQTKDSE